MQRLKHKLIELQADDYERQRAEYMARHVATFGDSATKRDTGSGDRPKEEAMSVSITPMVHQCDNCKFWKLHDPVPGQPIAGSCRRYPPQITHDESGFYQDNSFPVTANSEWCGEWNDPYA